MATFDGFSSQDIVQATERFNLLNENNEDINPESDIDAFSDHFDHESGSSEWSDSDNVKLSRFIQSRRTNVVSGRHRPAWSNSLLEVTKNDFTGPTPGPTVTLGSDKTDLDFFRLFFPKTCDELIAEQTNLYAQQKQR